MINSFVGFLGRACLSLVFIVAGIKKFFTWSATEQFVQQTLTDWSTKADAFSWVHDAAEWGLAHLFLVLLVATLLEVVGGLMVFLGISVRLGALLLAVFLAGTTVLVHHFWDIAEPQRQMELVNFMKNLSIFGGLLFVVSRGRCDRSSCQTQESSE